MCDILATFQINEDFQKVIMHNDVKLLSYQIKWNISTSKTVEKILAKKLYCHFK